MRRFILCLILTGVIGMTAGFGCANRVKFVRFSSSDPMLGVEMDYVKGWVYQEHKDQNSGYAGVVFFEDKPGDVPKAIIGLTAMESGRLNERMAAQQSLNLEAFADDLVSKRMKFKEAKVLSRGKTKVASEEAIVLELSYLTLDKLYSLDAKLIPVKEKVILFRAQEKFYILRYENGITDYPRYERAFAHISSSLRLKSAR